MWVRLAILVPMDQIRGRSYEPRRPGVAAALIALTLCGISACDSSTTPLATPASAPPIIVKTPLATRTAGATQAAGALVATSAPTATELSSTRMATRPTPIAAPDAVPKPPIAASEAVRKPMPPAAEAGAAPSATSVAVHPRVFRTPERDAPAAFVPPRAAAPPADAESIPGAPAVGAPPSRSNLAVVVLRATARTALEGFDLRVGYERALGTFAGNGQPAECTAGTGALVAANDRGDGQLRLLVASAQALPFPLDIFCRFTLTPGARIDAAAFNVRVAEVTSDAKSADPSLLIIKVVVQ